MGSPKQEQFISEHWETLSVNFAVGVGGSFDVLTGKVKRAPIVMQNFGLEWLWRLMMEPRKLWRRYLYTNSRFLWMSVKAMSKRVGSGSVTGSKKSGPIL